MSTIKQYIGDGETALFPITFPYLDQSHVGVSLNGFPMDFGAEFEFVGDSSIRFRPTVPGVGVVVELKRETPLDPLVRFQNGATLTQDDLNTAALQSLYSIEELWDRYETRFGEAAVRLSNGTFTDAQNLIDAAVASILESDLLDSLQGQIGDISEVGESVLSTIVGLDRNGTHIIDETVERREGDADILTRLALLGVRSDDNSAWILDLDTVKVSPTVSLGSRLTEIEATAGSFSAAIIAEQTARADADSALASDYELLQASVAANAAAILTETSARVSGDSSVVSTVTTLQATVNDHTAALQTSATVIDGLSAQYMVKTDVNGYVSGFGLYSDGATSEFIVLANKFAVVTPGASALVPFSVVGGVCYMQNVVIQDALIENLTVGKLTSGILTASITQNADINVGTGRIIWNNGTFMKVTGVGFGTSSQFLEWFGPSMSIASCSESNAIQYLRTDGDAYFGGTLSAGTISNSGSTTLGNATEFVLGDFTSAGNPIQVTATCMKTRTSTTETNAAGTSPAAPSPTLNPPTLTYVIEKRIGTGSWTTIATRNMSGTYTLTFRPFENGAEGEEDVSAAWIEEWSLSETHQTSTTIGSTSEAELRIRITTTNQPAFTSGRLALLSVE